jgi:hypothetical protein
MTDSPGTAEKVDRISSFGAQGGLFKPRARIYLDAGIAPGTIIQIKTGYAGEKSLAKTDLLFQAFSTGKA